jgi:LPS-assembly lipoprotein
MRARFASLTALAALAGCGLQPVYSGGSHSVAATTLDAIEIAPIPEKMGYLLTEALQRRFGERPDKPRYRLQVDLQDEILGFGIRGDNSIARERRALRARYQLIRVTTGRVVLDATAGSDLGIDRVSSDYAVVAAESTALERLATEVARQISANIALAAHDGRLTDGVAAATAGPAARSAAGSEPAPPR